MPWPWPSAKLGILKGIPSFAECQVHGTRQSFFKKKNLCRVPHDLAPGKEITKKIKKLFAGCPCGATPGKEIIKKNKKIFARCFPGTTPGKENLKKN